MCGIAGVMTRDGTAPDPAMLDRMRRALAHRGPDGHAVLVRGGTALVHLRLAIVDLITGDQPLFGAGAPEHAPALIANGEIYNDPVLRGAMADASLRTHSDCEPAVFLYQRHGPAFAEHLRGMYAIAIDDPRRGRLVLARDPFGIKPLYYAETATLFAFASEPQALRAVGLGDAPPAATQRAELLQLKFTTGAATIFPGIARVLPGETLVVERGRIAARHRLDALPSEGAGAAADHGARALGDVLADSVAVHLRSDVPYGLFLSGGIDSAALLALMTRVAGGRVRAITMGWDGGAEADESNEAERLARLQGADCHRLSMSAADFWTFAPRIAACVDDPTADAAVLPTWMLARAARADGLKVTLCGEGGDEVFGGYSRYRKQRAPFRWMARPPRSRGVFPSSPALAGWDAAMPAIRTAAACGRSGMQAAQAADIAEWLPNDLLVKLDRCLMAHGVEGRTPFLDPRVAAFAWGLPDEAKVGLRYGKRLLRAWLAEAFPEAGAWARKKGFKPPVGAWIAARASTLGPLVSGQPGVAEIMDARLVRGALANAGENSQPAWSLLFYALWHSHHVLGIAADGTIEEVLGAARQNG